MPFVITSVIVATHCRKLQTHIDPAYVIPGLADLEATFFSYQHSAEYTADLDANVGSDREDSPPSKVLRRKPARRVRRRGKLSQMLQMPLDVVSEVSYTPRHVEYKRSQRFS